MTAGTHDDLVLAKDRRQSSSARRPARAGATRRKARRSLTAWAFLVPTFAFIGVFSYWPAVRALEGAFTDWDGVSPPTWTGLANFEQLLGDSIFLGSFVHLLVWSLIGIPTGMFASLLVALLIYRLRSQRAQYWFRVAFALTLCLPGIVGILTWANFYQIDGVLDVILSHIGLGQFATAWLADPRTALGALIFLGFPWVSAFNLLVFYAGLQRIPPDLLDAAAVDGVSSLRRLWYIELPLIRGQMKVILVLSIIGITQNLLPPLLLTEGGPGDATWTPVLYMYEQAFQYDTIGYALAVAFVLFVVSLVLSVLTMKYLRSDENGKVA